MPEGAQTVSEIAVALTLDSSQFVAGLESAEAAVGRFSAKARSGPAKPVGMPESPGRWAAGSTPVPGISMPIKDATRAAYRGWRDSFVTHASKEPVSIPVTANIASVRAMKKQIQEAIGTIPLKVSLDTSSMSKGSSLNLLSALYSNATGQGFGASRSAVKSIIRGHGIEPEPRQAGGPIQPRRRYIVGENGPEVFESNERGRILPHGRVTSRRLDGGSTRPHRWTIEDGGNFPVLGGQCTTCGLSQQQHYRRPVFNSGRAIPSGPAVSTLTYSQMQRIVQEARDTKHYDPERSEMLDRLIRIRKELSTMDFPAGPRGYSVNPVEHLLRTYAHENGLRPWSASDHTRRIAGVMEREIAAVKRSGGNQSPVGFFHATPDVAGVLSRGLLTGDELGSVGLGGTSHTTSSTYSLARARQIANTMRMVSLIAREEARPSQVAEFLARRAKRVGLEGYYRQPELIRSARSYRSDDKKSGDSRLLKWFFQADNDLFDVGSSNDTTSGLGVFFTDDARSRRRWANVDPRNVGVVQLGLRNRDYGETEWGWDIRPAEFEMRIPSSHLSVIGRRGRGGPMRAMAGIRPLNEENIGRGMRRINFLGMSLLPGEVARSRDWYTIAHAQALGDIADIDPSLLANPDRALNAHAMLSPGNRWPMERLAAREVMSNPAAWATGSYRPVGGIRGFVPGFPGMLRVGAARGYGNFTSAANELLGQGNGPQGPKVFPFAENLSGRNPNLFVGDARMAQIYSGSTEEAVYKQFTAMGPARREMLEAYERLYPKFQRLWGLNNISEFQAILWSGHGLGADIGDDWQRTKTGILIPRHGIHVPYHRALGGMVPRAGVGSRAYKATLANQGGTFPVDPNTPVPTSGHALGIAHILGAEQLHVPVGDFRGFLKAFKTQAQAGSPFIGTWLDPDTGLIDVDPSTVVSRKREADMVLRFGDEKAAFDLRHMSTWYASDKGLRATRERIEDIIYGRRKGAKHALDGRYVPAFGRGSTGELGIKALAEFKDELSALEERFHYPFSADTEWIPSTAFATTRNEGRVPFVGLNEFRVRDEADFKGGWRSGHFPHGIPQDTPWLRGVAAHEMGHVIEYSNPSAVRDLRARVLREATGANTLWLKGSRPIGSWVNELVESMPGKKFPTPRRISEAHDDAYLRSHGVDLDAMPEGISRLRSLNPEQERALAALPSAYAAKNEMDWFAESLHAALLQPQALWTPSTQMVAEALPGLRNPRYNPFRAAGGPVPVGMLHHMRLSEVTHDPWALMALTGEPNFDRKKKDKAQHRDGGGRAKFLRGVARMLHENPDYTGHLYGSIFANTDLTMEEVDAAFAEEMRTSPEAAMLRHRLGAIGSRLEARNSDVAHNLFRDSIGMGATRYGFAEQYYNERGYVPELNYQLATLRRGFDPDDKYLSAIDRAASIVKGGMSLTPIHGSPYATPTFQDPFGGRHVAGFSNEPEIPKRRGPGKYMQGLYLPGLSDKPSFAGPLGPVPGNLTYDIGDYRGYPMSRKELERARRNPRNYEFATIIRNSLGEDIGQSHTSVMQADRWLRHVHSKMRIDALDAGEPAEDWDEFTASINRSPGRNFPRVPGMSDEYVLHPEALFVHPEYRNLRLASRLYSAIEQATGIQSTPSSAQYDAGHRFWHNEHGMRTVGLVPTFGPDLDLLGATHGVARNEWSQSTRGTNQYFYTDEGWGPVRDIPAHLPRRHFALGGNQSDGGLYIVGEVGDELFVPNRSAHLIPHDVMKQIPKRAEGGPTGIFKVGKRGQEYFTPPEDGWIIPHRLVDKVPHAERGKAGKDPYTGLNVATQETYAPLDEQERLRATAMDREARERNAGRTSQRVADVGTPGPDAKKRIALREKQRAGAESAAARAQQRRLDAAYKRGQMAVGGKMSQTAAGQAITKSQMATFGAMSYEPSEAMALQEQFVGSQGYLGARNPKGLAAVLGSLGLGGGEKARQRAYQFQTANRAFAQAEKAYESQAAPLRSTIAAEKKHIENLKEQQAGLDPLDEKYHELKGNIDGYTKSLDRHEKSLAALAPEEAAMNKAREEAVAAFQKTVPGFSAVARNFAAVLATTTAYGLAMQGVGTAMGVAEQIARPMADSLMGWHATATRVTTEMGQSVTQLKGNVQAASGALAGQSAMGASGLAAVSQYLAPSAQAKAGGETAASQMDAYRAMLAMSGGGAPEGLYGGYGGLFGTSIGASEVFGGGKGFLENVAATASSLFNPAQSNGGTYGAPHLDVGMMQGGQKYTTGGYGTIDVAATAKNSKLAKAFIDDFNGALDRGTKDMKDFAVNVKLASGLTADETKEMDTFITQMESTKQFTGDQAKYMRQLNTSGVGFKDATGRLVKDASTLSRAVQQASIGYTKTSPEAFISQIQQSLQGQAYSTGQMGAFQRQTMLPFQTAIGALSQGYGAGPGGGFLSVAERMGGPAAFSGSNVSMAGMTGAPTMPMTAYYADKGLADMRSQLVSVYGAGRTGADVRTVGGKPVSGGVVGEFDSLVRSARSLGKGIGTLTREMAALSAGLASAQFANEMRLASRALADARGFLGMPGGSKYGQTERTVYNAGYESQLLSIGLEKRQIATQLAMAQFASPGQTGEERMAMYKESTTEAEIRMRQVKLGETQVTGQHALTMEGAQRQVTDTEAIVALTQKARDTSVALAADSQKLSDMQTELTTVNGRLGTFAEQVSSIKTGEIQAAAEYIGTFGGDIQTANGVIEQLVKNLQTWVGTAGVPGGNTPSNQSAKPNPNATTWDQIFPNSPNGGYTIPSSYGPNEIPLSGPNGQPITPSQTSNGGARAAGYLGYHSTPTTFTVGEAAGEQVAILRNPRESMLPAQSSQNGPINVAVNISGTSVRSDADIQHLAQKVAYEVERILGRKSQLVGLRGPSY